MLNHFSLHWRVAAVLSTALACTGLASAQDSDADLRRQNEQLSAQIRDLQRELLQAQDRIQQLEGTISQLQRQAAAPRRSSTAGSPAPSLDDEIVSVDESVPNASPRALFKALVASYEATMAGLPIGKPGERDRRAYLRKLENWRAGVIREFRSPIVWHVRVIDARLGPDRQRIVTFLAVDPETDARLGNSFDVVLSQTLVERLANFEARGDLGVLVMRGTVFPEIRIDEDRESRGTFDNPPFIGPFAEFLFRIEVASLKLLKDEVEDIASGNPAPNTNTGSPPPRPEE